MTCIVWERTEENLKQARIDAFLYVLLMGTTLWLLYIIVVQGVLTHFIFPLFSITGGFLSGATLLWLTDVACLVFGIRYIAHRYLSFLKSTFNGTQRADAQPIEIGQLKVLNKYARNSQPFKVMLKEFLDINGCTVGELNMLVYDQLKHHYKIMVLGHGLMVNQQQATAMSTVQGARNAAQEELIATLYSE